MTILVQLRSVYGNDLIYPVCERAKTFAALTNQKTLTAHALRHIRALGYRVQLADHFGQPTATTLAA